MSCVPSLESVVARGLRLVKAATHCESDFGCASAPSGYHSTFGYSLASRETETDLSRWRICASSQTIQTQLELSVQSFLYRPPYVPQVYSSPQNVTDRMMSQIMSSEADENCSLAEKGDLVAIGTGLAKSLILSDC